jgi:hypothetical protein
MRSRRWLPVTLAVLSLLLAAIFGLLANLTSTYLADALRPYATWVYALTGIVFLVSAGVLVWQIVATGHEPAPTEATGPPGTHVNMNNVRAGGDVHVTVAGGNIVQGGSPPTMPAVPGAGPGSTALSSPGAAPGPTVSPGPATAPVGSVSSGPEGDLGQQQAAILRAYNREELRQVLRFCMNEDLDTLAADRGFADQVFAVLTWSVRSGRHAELLACLRRARPHLGI